MAITTRRIGPADHGQRMTLDEFVEADFQEGWLYELARGVIEVTEVPGISHGWAIGRIAALFALYGRDCPGVIDYQAGGACCRIRTPGMQSSRRPDQAIYLMQPPPGDAPWTYWAPTIVVEVVIPESEERDYVEKREEYLRAGVLEYWILDMTQRVLRVNRRAGDVWEETVVPPGGSYRPYLLPGLEARPDELLGLAKIE